MTWRKATLLIIGLSILAMLVACSSSSHNNTTTTTIAISATGGTPQSAAVNTAFATLTATVTSNGSPAVGVSVVFTAPSSGASCTFPGPSNVDNETTNTSGVATSQVCTANATAGSYSVTASATGATSPATFSLTNTSGTGATLSDGNYVFSLSGFNVNDGSLFYVAGTFTVASGAVTGGEQDYVDSNNYSNANSGGQDLINPIGSSIAATADGNLQIVLTTCSGSTCTSTDSVVGANGVETINAAVRPSKAGQAELTEFDSSGSASGTLLPQDPVAASATPSLGYAFQVAGYDNGTLFGGIAPLNVGGIINVDGSGTVSGTGSIFDADDAGTLFTAETLQASTGTVSAPDAFGRVVFSLTPTDTTDFAQISWVGYIADSSRVYLVETADAYFGTTGGLALSQGASTGTFGNGSVSGSTYGAAMTGFDVNGALQLVGEFTFNSGGSVTGFIDFNDLVSTEPASPDPVSASSFTVDPTGRVTISGLTDGTNTFDVQFYLDGNGDAVAITLDGTDALGATLGGQVNNTGLTDASFTGSYALAVTGWDGTQAGEISGAGTVTATGTGDTLSGSVNLNDFGVPSTGVTLSGTYTYLTGSAGILSPTSITGLDTASSTTASSFNGYEIDSSGDTVLIELDLNQLTLGFTQH